MKDLVINSIEDGVSVTCNGEKFSITKLDEYTYEVDHPKTYNKCNSLQCCVDFVNNEFRIMFGNDVEWLDLKDIEFEFEFE